MFAPFCFVRNVFGSKSPVDRHKIPFWNWVAINIHDKNKLSGIKKKSRFTNDVFARRQMHLDFDKSDPLKECSPFEVAMECGNLEFLDTFNFELPNKERVSWYHSYINRLIGSNIHSSCTSLRKGLYKR